ncbi:LysR substrate-binding domain-containing protein [Nocardioides convexus]|uniref:LysR family transcriptional regulator n=1 Tax=Nocardioides convexus TaxID=2712224 RepID=UPI00241874AD|nr:LysR substrate-binding domain-containing protein [Nocardioides convexus]
MLTRYGCDHVGTARAGAPSPRACSSPSRARARSAQPRPSLGITQQAASSRVRTMEALVGEPLVARSKRGSESTPTGELVVQWAGRVLDAAQELDAGITAVRADRRGHLDIAASLTIAEHLLPGWLVGLRAQQVQRGQQPTDITMTATNTQRVTAMVEAGEVSVGFVEGPDAPRGLRHRLVGTDEPARGRRPRAPVGPAVPAPGERVDPGGHPARRAGGGVGDADRPGTRARRPADGRPGAGVSPAPPPSGRPSRPEPGPRRSGRTPYGTTWRPAAWCGSR